MSVTSLDVGTAGNLLAADSVAIVGADCRFADVSGVDELWDALAGGRELIASPDTGATSGGTLGRGVLARPEHFDAGLFAISPGEAELIDPQQRVFLECCWHALEHTGYDPGQFSGDIAVFAGVGRNTYLPSLRGRDVTTEQAMLVDYGNEKDFVATRVAYRLGLRGPAMTVQTGCSTSLSAVHLACQSLLNYECDMALAGGVSILLTGGTGYQHSEGGILSMDGHCRPFDAASSGVVPADGVGVVVLRRLADAVADGDHVLAVIRGSAMRNDGTAKVGFSAPSVDGQIAAMRAAYAVAEVDPATVEYVETHGTGTELGDPVEIAALRAVLDDGADPGGPTCCVGAVKSYLGHADTASGVAGLITAMLSLHRETLLPVRDFDRPNPRLDLAGSRFRFLTEPTRWPRRDRPRRAAVNSLGVGGTNVHVVLEEAPVVARPLETPGTRLVPLSARTAAALAEAERRLSTHVQARPSIPLADVAFTLQTGRRHWDRRSTVVASDTADLGARLRDGRILAAAGWEDAQPRLALLFPGGGAQHVGMAERLCVELPHFAGFLRSVAEESGQHLHPTLSAWIADGARAAAAQPWIEQPELALPALFLTELAMARTLLRCGLTPDGLLGHSLGEYVVAQLAGVFSVEDALAAVAVRGRLIGGVSGGGMLSVRLPEHELRALLPDDVEIAAVNAVDQCVVSGVAGPLDGVEERLRARGVDVRRVPLTTAAHSSLVEPYLAEFGEFLAGLRLRPPLVPFVSSMTGAWADPAAVVTPAYWVRHLRRPVRFADGLRTLVGSGPATVLIEVGPGGALTALARRADLPGRVWAGSVAAHRGDGGRSAVEALLTTLGSAWVRRVHLDWTALRPTGASRLPLPGYPFQRSHCSVRSVRPNGATVVDPPLPAPDHDEVGLFLPGWRREPAPAIAAPAARPWVVVPDRHGVATRIADTLRDRGHHVVSWEPGPVSLADAVESVRVDGSTVEVVYAAGLDHVPADLAGADHLDRYRRLVTDCARIGQAVTTCPPRSVRLAVLASGAADVTGGDVVDPATSPLLSLCSTLPAEADVTARFLDIDGRAPDQASAARVVDELERLDPAPLRALRGRHTWIPVSSPVSADDRSGLDLGPRPSVLITGGLGGVGIAIAEWLVVAHGARLTLVSRSGAAGPERTAALHRLAELGGDVRVHEGDVSDPAAMRAAVAATVGHFGDLRLVIHAAAVPYGGMLDFRQDSDSDELHAAKAGGATVLLDAVRHLSDVRVLLISSLITPGGAPGSFDYHAANLFLDALAQADPGRVTSIAWDRWQGTGMARQLEERHAELTGERMPTGMPPTAAVALLGRCLDMAARGERQLTVARTEAAALAARSWADGPPPRVDGIEQSNPSGDVAGRTRHRRGDHLGPYVTPAGGMEQLLADVWSEVFNTAPIGTTDNFFELGGDSLLGMRISGLIRAQTNRGFPARLLFAHPTIRELATALHAVDESPDSAMPKLTRAARPTVGSILSDEHHA